jgi:hypothetical protein
MKYDFKGPKMAFQNIIFKEYRYLNLVHKMGKVMKLPLFLMVFPRVTDPDPAKVPDPCGSGSTTLIMTAIFIVKPALL